MSVPIFEVTAYQVTDWCQTGRLVGCSDPLCGAWIVVTFGTRFSKPLHYVHGCICETWQDANDYCKDIELVRNQPVFDGQLCFEYEIWHVVSEQDLIDNTPVFPALAGHDYVFDYDKQEACTLIMHWVPALGSHVAVLVTENGFYLPNDWQSLQPRTMADVRHYDWLPCEEFGDFGACDYLKVLDQLDALQVVQRHDLTASC